MLHDAKIDQDRTALGGQCLERGLYRDLKQPDDACMHHHHLVIGHLNVESRPECRSSNVVTSGPGK